MNDSDYLLVSDYKTNDDSYWDVVWPTVGRRGAVEDWGVVAGGLAEGVVAGGRVLERRRAAAMVAGDQVMVAKKAAGMVVGSRVTERKMVVMQVGRPMVVSLETVVDAGLIGEEDGSDAGGEADGGASG